MGRIMLPILEFISAENATDLRFLFGPSSIGDVDAHSRDG
jgi:hypothetical protein